MVDDGSPNLDAVSRFLGRVMDGPVPAMLMLFAMAVGVARDVIRYLHTLEAELFPPEVHVTIIRDYGGTADQKVGDLVVSLVIAVLTVVIFIGMFLGWRAALVVGLAVPICYGATLGLDFMAGYTINRVTLFALILSLGLLVDDPITGVDNIERYLRMGRHSKRDAVLLAMAEIRGALIMSTLAIIIAFALQRSTPSRHLSVFPHRWILTA